jgi:hypothetical protein
MIEGLALSNLGDVPRSRQPDRHEHRRTSTAANVTLDSTGLAMECTGSPVRHQQRP